MLMPEIMHRLVCLLCCLVSTEMCQILKGLLRNANQVHISLNEHLHECFLNLLSINSIDYLVQKVKLVDRAS
jgi:hypothetical protein